jgi:hypothetical protein
VESRILHGSLGHLTVSIIPNLGALVKCAVERNGGNPEPGGIAVTIPDSFIRVEGIFPEARIPEVLLIHVTVAPTVTVTTSGIKPSSVIDTEITEVVRMPLPSTAGVPRTRVRWAIRGQAAAAALPPPGQWVCGRVQALRLPGLLALALEWTPGTWPGP